MCHQTFLFYYSAHSFPISLNFRRSWCSDVIRENIVACELCFLCTSRMHMLCLHWSSPISSSVLCCKCIDCRVGLGITMWARGCHTSSLILHCSRPFLSTTCSLISVAWWWFYTCQKVISWLQMASSWNVPNREW